MDRSRVTMRDYLGLRSTDDPNRWQLELTPRVLTPAGAMHGGAALAATVEALEGATARPLVWATAHYLTHAGPRGLLDVDVSIEVAGHQTTQARAVLHLGDVEVLLTVASLGMRGETSPGRWVQPSLAPGPGDAPSRCSTTTTSASPRDESATSSTALAAPVVPCCGADCPTVAVP